jgi:hypothetical protein
MLLISEKRFFKFFSFYKIVLMLSLIAITLLSVRVWQLAKKIDRQNIQTLTSELRAVNGDVIYGH